MDKNAIQKYAVWARNELIAQIKQRAYLYGIDEKGYGDENTDTVNGRVLSRDEKKQRKAFISEIKSHGFEQVVEEVAYTWFNRFIALRFMEVNDYLPSHVRVFSDSTGAFKPEILRDVLHLELDGLDKAKVSELLNTNATDELYRYLLLTQCNALNAALPEMFEKLGSYTEMLLPGNILKSEGVIGRLVDDIPEEDFKDAVQIIGWMYQYYNTEPKQAVFDGLKKNIKITKDKIPAATQLFTPDWIVRYMVENSLGRLWFESHPNDALKANWKYYLDEAEQTPEVAEKLRVIRSQSPVKSPEDIRLIDPCMGSGHILVYAFDVLMQIYESEGYNPRDAAKLILEKNIYGLDIDRRAYQLAYFSLMMKARQYNRRIFTEDVKPKVFYFIDSSRISKEHIELMGADLLPVEVPVCMENISLLLDDFIDATEFGSIMKINRIYPYELLRKFAKSQKTGQLTLTENPQNYDDLGRSEIDLLQIIDLAELLTQKYDVVVTNPPYMGSFGMGRKLAEFVKKNYPDSKSDIFAVFIEKCGELLKPAGYQAMITQHAWMFLSSYEKLRGKLIQRDIINMAHLGARAFEEIGGEVVQTTSFIIRKGHTKDYKGTYARLVDYNSQLEKENAFLVKNDLHTAQQDNFAKIPGSPVAYWVGINFVLNFNKAKFLSNVSEAMVSGNKTANNDEFLRLIWEVGKQSIGERYHLYAKGGAYRKWFGNIEYIIDWSDRAKASYRSNSSACIVKKEYWFRRGLTYTDLTSKAFSCRFLDDTYLFDMAGPGILISQNILNYMMGLLNSAIAREYLSILSSTFHYKLNELNRVPVLIDNEEKPKIDELVNDNILLSRTDWDAFETSWDFKRHPLICGMRTVDAAFDKWECEAKERFDTLKSNEEELNRIFIDIYGLQDELTPEVEDKDVTVRRADVGREIRGLISYAVGCMFGRYSLDTEGLAYAGGDWDTGKYRSFIPDKDNILPICDDEYFDDDILGRFVDFIRVVYGAETLEENLKFIADALGDKGTPREVIRNYFLNGFYKDHCKIYKKRPIYWLFDSGKKNGFKALIYLHRYQSDLLAKLRTDYVHEQQERYRTQLSHIATALNTAAGSERARLLKQQAKLADQLKEITAFEEKVHHLADQNIEIDLDDGVKKNYEIFSDILAKI